MKTGELTEEQREKRNAYQRQWRAAHKDSVSASNKKYAKKVKDAKTISQRADMDKDELRREELKELLAVMVENLTEDRLFILVQVAARFGNIQENEQGEFLKEREQHE